MTFTAACNNYLKNLQQILANPHATGELSLRPHLDELLNAAKSTFAPALQLIGEAKANDFGRPDYVLTQTSPSAAISQRKNGSKTAKTAASILTILRIINK